MSETTYIARRGEIETYFDRTASEAWAKLTSDAPVSGVRATVRAGRDRIRETLLSWLPEDMTGLRLLDAGCGAGQLAVEAARRGAEVVAIDLAGSLVDLARDRAGDLDLPGSVDFRVGDFLDPALGRFDHVAAMDSLIHYRPRDAARALSTLAARTSRSIVFTTAPKTPLLSVMHAAGKLFPRSDRSPAIVPTGEADLLRLVAATGAPVAAKRTHTVNSGFYVSRATELRIR